jgi:predicted transcriptional regulator
MKITSETSQGRILLALRAGWMNISQIRERVNDSSKYIADLQRKNLIEKKDDLYRLTENGLKSCPNRRDNMKIGATE